MESYQLYWNDISIGIFENPIPDMWYLEGQFIPNESDEAKEFVDLGKSINPLEVLHDLTKGIRAVLKFDDDTQVNVVVIALDSDNHLCVRQLIE